MNNTNRSNSSSATDNSLTGLKSATPFPVSTQRPLSMRDNIPQNTYQDVVFNVRTFSLTLFCNESPKIMRNLWVNSNENFEHEAQPILVTCARANTNGAVIVQPNFIGERVGLPLTTMKH